MNKRRLLYSGLLVLLSIWLGWTVLVDFVVVPSVFRNINNFFEAGDLGIYLFHRLNSLEVVIATLVMTLTVFMVKKNSRAFPFLIASVLTFLIAITYFSWLIPKITHLTQLWKMSEEGAKVIIADVQQEHQFYHRLYVTLDSVKILVLTFMLGAAIVKEEWTA